MTVIKRDGREAEFDIGRIERAIKLANKSVDKDERISDEIFGKVMTFIQKELKGKDCMNVEDIQDLVEKALMNKDCYEVAKSFILYRDERTKIRLRKNHLMSVINEKLSAKKVQNQNANVDEYSFGGRIGEADSELLRQLALDEYMSAKTKKNHIENKIYQHDLDKWVIGEHNCADENTWVHVCIKGKVKTLQLKTLGKLLDCPVGKGKDVSKKEVQILSRDGYTTLNKVWCRKTKENEKVFTLKTVTGQPLVLTGEHQVPVLRDKREQLLKVEDIREGDELITSKFSLSSDTYKDCFIDFTKFEDDDFLDLRIVNFAKLYHYLTYKYDIIYTHYAKEHNLSNAHNVFQMPTLRDLKCIMSDFSLDWDLLSTLRLKCSFSKKTYPLCIPYSANLAKLYAYIYADGGVYVNEEKSLFQLTFTNTNEDLIDDFIDTYADVFGYRLTKSYPTEKSTSPCIRVTDGSRIAVKLFKDFAGAKKYGSADISMPDFVINGSDTIKYAYLSACIDTDGCLSTDIAYTTCGELYSEQMMILLKSLGYSPIKNISSKKGSTYKFGSVVGIRNYDSYNISLRRNEDKNRFFEKINSLKKLDHIAYKGISVGGRSNTRISSIEVTTDTHTVYDLETASHYFVANDYVVHNCLSIPFDSLLENGFNTRQTDVRPANSVSTALQLVAVLFQLQSLQQFGGCSATHLDWTLVPYIRKSFYKHYCTICEILPFVRKPVLKNVADISIEDKVYRGKHWWNFVKRYVYFFARKFTEKEVNQGVEGMYHNLNTLQSRSGNQLPFTSINYGTCTLAEGRMAISSFLKNSIKGVGKFHKTPIFPCGIFQLMDGVNTKKGEPNYDLFKLALKSTATRLYPNYVNVDWSVNKGYDRNDPRTYTSTMGCRTYNGYDINGFGQLKDGRGNIAPCTIILPTLAMMAKKASEKRSTDIVEEFMTILAKMIEEAKDSLIERFEWICSQSPKSAKFMWENNTMVGYVPEEGIKSAMKHGTLAIGQIGLAETLQILVGCDHTDPKGMELAKRIEQMFYDKCKEYKEHYKLNFGVYYSPAENLCRTALMKFRAKYGSIPNVSDRDYFTNSMHIPVWKEISPFEKIDLESQLTGYSSAGCITYVELDENAVNNIDALEQLVLYAKSKDIPYFAINVPSDTCNICGYSGKLGEVCPVCGAKDEGENFSRLGRVTGYLTGDYRRAFNAGKQSEYKDRYKHSNKLLGWLSK